MIPMEQTMKKFLIPLILGITACTTGPTPLPEARSPAAKLYAARCGSCHSLPHPRRLHYREWQQMVALMQQRMQERHMPPLTDKEQAIILKYLQNHAR